MVAVGSAESQQAVLDKTENSDLPMPYSIYWDESRTRCSKPWP